MQTLFILFCCAGVPSVEVQHSTEYSTVSTPHTSQHLSPFLMAMSAQQIEAAQAYAFRQLVQHLQMRTDVQNIELMILSGFCRYDERSASSFSLHTST